MVCLENFTKQHSKTKKRILSFHIHNSVLPYPKHKHEMKTMGKMYENEFETLKESHVIIITIYHPQFNDGFTI